MRNEYSDPANKRLQRALFLLGNGRAEEAETAINRFLSDHPESAPAHRAKAMILAHRADYNGAEESLLLAIGYSTDIYQSCYFELGEVLVQSGRFEDAIEKLSIAIDSMRASGNTWEISSAVFVRAFAYFKLGDFVNALRDLDVAVDGSIYYCGEMWDKFKVLNEVNRAQKSARRF